ncbi:MAG: ABC transporter substrate-binding protein [Anaerolineae bacterium]
MEKIVVSRDSDINDLDPQNFKSDAGYEAVENLYNGLFDLEARPGPGDTWRAASQDVVGEVVEDYELSEDGITLTLHLRRGVRFSNGASCLASSVKFTLERALLGPGYLRPLMEMLTITESEQIHLLDDYTLELHLAHPTPLLWEILPLQSFSVLDPETTKTHATSDDPWGSGWYRSHALGTGPYLLSQSKPGVEYVFERNPYYWRPGSVRNDGVVLKVIPSAKERLEALKRGHIDVVIGLQPRDLAPLEDDPDLVVLSFPTTICKVMSMNTALVPFDDLRVRQAISYAIPYRQLQEEVMAGYCQPLTSPVPKGMPTHEGGFWVYDTDWERARQLLAEAGYGQGFATSLIVRRPRADETLSAEAIQRALQVIGVQVELAKVSDAEYYARLKEFPLAIFETLSWVNDPIYHLLWNLKGDAPKNLANYRNARVDELIEDGMHETDLHRRRVMSQEAQRIIVEEAPWAFLYQPHWTVVTSSHVTGYAIYPDLLPRYRFLRKRSQEAAGC